MTLNLIGNTSGLVGREVDAYSRPAKDLTRSATMGDRFPLDEFPGRVVLHPEGMTVGRLYEFTLLGQAVFARKKPSGGIQLFYVPDDDAKP